MSKDISEEEPPSPSQAGSRWGQIQLPTVKQFVQSEYQFEDPLPHSYWGKNRTICQNNYLYYNHIYVNEGSKLFEPNALLACSTSIKIVQVILRNVGFIKNREEPGCKSLYVQQKTHTKNVPELQSLSHFSTMISMQYKNRPLSWLKYITTSVDMLSDVSQFKQCR